MADRLLQHQQSPVDQFMARVQAPARFREALVRRRSPLRCWWPAAAAMAAASRAGA